MSKAVITIICLLGAFGRARSDDNRFLFSNGRDSLLAVNYAVYQKSADAWALRGEFVVPTVSLLLQYRPHVVEHFGFDESKEKFVGVVEDVSSAITAVAFDKTTVWVGFGFYEGEGWEGIGGIGFVDLQTGRVGVLRHPALVDCSVESLLVTDTVIYAMTVGHYELTQTIGNGLVTIDRRTLRAMGKVPFGNGILWDKDSEENVQAQYRKSILSLISDSTLHEREIPQYSEEQLKEASRCGVDSFMVACVQQERAVRGRAVSAAKVLFIDTIPLPAVTGGAESRGARSGVSLYGWGRDSLAKNCSVTGFTCFQIEIPESFFFPGNLGIRPTNVYPGLIDDDNRWIIVSQGKSFFSETSKERITITLEKLETHETDCRLGVNVGPIEYFKSVRVSVEFRELQE